MTFEEWWKRKACKDILHCEKCKLVTNCATVERLCRDAWEASQLQSKDEIDALTKERNKWIKRCDTGVKKAWNAAQPKWTLCKDGMPTEDGNYLVAVLLPYGHRIVLTSNYDANNCDFWEIDPDREIIAWMPLPEAPNVHDD